MRNPHLVAIVLENRSPPAQKRPFSVEMGRHKSLWVFGENQSSHIKESICRGGKSRNNENGKFRAIAERDGVLI